MTVTAISPAQEAPAVNPEGAAQAASTATPQPTTNPSPSSPSDRPAWLPEKFSNPEQLAKAYAELEKRQSQKALAAAPQVTPTTTPETGAEAPQAVQELTDGLSAKGLDIRDFHSEYQQNGSLSEESYAKLAKAGYDKTFINDFIAGQEALAARHNQAIFDSVGGEEHYRAVQTWAKANMSQAELVAFNEITESGSFDQIKLAVQGLNARYSAANGRDPKLVGGTAPGVAAGFASRAEVIAAMSDPRYKKDEAYRAQVIHKMQSGSPFMRR